LRPHERSAERALLEDLARDRSDVRGLTESISVKEKLLMELSERQAEFARQKAELQARLCDAGDELRRLTDEIARLQSEAAAASLAGRRSRELEEKIKMLQAKVC
jgi:predicted RNase H-like nuclease (RuvC/YqgF family)